MLIKPDKVKVISTMAQKDISCKTLIAKTGLSPLTITNIRQGKRCNALSLSTVATVLGVSIEDIMEV